MPPPKAFRGKLVRAPGVGTWTFVPIPFDLAALAGSRAQLRVRGTINGVPFSTNALPDGSGAHFLVVNRALRGQIGAEAGDTVAVTCDVDRRPRPVTVPADLQRALNGKPALSKTFKSLAPSHQRAHIRWIIEAKQAPTRARRIAATLDRLAQGGR